MEESLIKISNLNDFIFCPRSIYFHNLYMNFDEKNYHSTYQVNGKIKHKNIDKKKYSTKKNILEGIDVYSEELGIIGKADIIDLDKKTLIERKAKIKKIYEGYYLQIYAIYFCLIEMGFKIEKLVFYSISDNKNFNIDLPNEKEKNKLKEIIKEIREFSLTESFKKNPNKCNMCIYRELCDY
ncbi:MAG: type V CRISPR-associated protein Cas4 [Candidatus Woesearchaeota archaeon]